MTAAPQNSALAKSRGVAERLVAKFSKLPHKVQQRFAMVADAVFCAIATWIAFALRLGFLYVPAEHFLFVVVVAELLWFPIAHMRGVYRSILRYSGGRTMMGLAAAGAVMAAIMSVAFATIHYEGLPRTVAVLQPLTFVAILAASRLFVRFVLVDMADASGGKPVRRVLIYGAGRAGQQLALSLRHEQHLRVSGYIDDDPSLVGHRLDGLKVYSPAEAGEIHRQLPIDEVLLALPNISRVRRKEIVEALQGHSFSVRVLPPTAKIIDGDVSISDLRPVLVEDLLGRDPVPPDAALLSRNISDKSVLVTGAGGSIGSELCRQIMLSGPRRLILLEQSEFALYSIEEELRNEARANGIDLVGELGSVASANTMRRLFERWKPETVFHAAAYKHVPIVERNPVRGVLNNVFGTLNCCREAEKAGVKSFILVSTDKAVRPTNVMGASKRVAELILQARAAAGSSTRFTMVRFGNVLGSSGSVVPKFRAQIAAGGPVTLTDREVTRYFMTIPEASQLVIQAGAMAEGGDVFVLDMGPPIKIYDLARAMIELSGLKVRDRENPDGDIEIVEIGLREGEKRYEELLIGDNPEATFHPRIIRAREEYLAWPELEEHLERLQHYIENGDDIRIRALLAELVPGFMAGSALSAPAITSSAA